MLKTRILPFYLIACLALCGCQVSGEVENQAYVLVMALDRTQDGALGLTVRIPSVGKSDAKSGDGEGTDSPYLTFSVSGTSWPMAMDALQWATPRKINLSHIEMIVVSARLASEHDFPSLMNQLSDTPHLYTTACLVVCEGSAKAFLEAGKTVIGTRMSAELRTMLRQYAAQGYIPFTSLADTCYTANSIYADPVAIWGFLANDASQAEGAAYLDEFPRVLDSPMTQRFYGAALFRNGVFIGRLSPPETALLGLIRGQRTPIAFGFRGKACELTPASKPRRNVEFRDDGTDLTLRVRLYTSEGLSHDEISALEAAMEDALSALIDRCQQLRCDPFGFAEIAARGFPTVQQWLACDWRDRFASAALHINVQIHLR